jgi:hypothetical protein
MGYYFWVKSGRILYCGYYPPRRGKFIKYKNISFLSQNISFLSHSYLILIKITFLSQNIPPKFLCGKPPNSYGAGIFLYFLFF